MYTTKYFHSEIYIMPLTELKSLYSQIEGLFLNKVVGTFIRINETRSSLVKNTKSGGRKGQGRLSRVVWGRGGPKSPGHPHPRNVKTRRSAQTTPKDSLSSGQPHRNTKTMTIDSSGHPVTIRRCERMRFGMEYSPRCS